MGSRLPDTFFGSVPNRHLTVERLERIGWHSSDAFVGLIFASHHGQEALTLSGGDTRTILAA